MTAGRPHGTLCGMSRSCPEGSRRFARSDAVVEVRTPDGELVPLRALALSPVKLLVEDLDLPTGVPCRFELCTGELRLTGRGTIADRPGPYADLVVSAWDAPTAARALSAHVRQGRFAVPGVAVLLGLGA